MACLVADEDGIVHGGVARKGAVTHALARTAGARETAHLLCAFDAAGTIRDGQYWASRVDEEDIIRRDDPAPPDRGPGSRPSPAPRTRG